MPSAKSAAPLPPAFRRRIDAVFEKLAETEFFVLVWGPSQQTPREHEKRKAIKAHLEKSLGSDSVFFSEDERFKADIKAHGLVTAEGAQAVAADAVVVLATSIGAHTEIVQYQALLREKAIVFTPSDYKRSSGFASTAYNSLKVEGYSADEFDSCDEIRRLALEFVETLRFQKYHASRLQDSFSA